MLDIEVLQNLTDDQKNRYMKMEQLLESDGWALLQQWLQGQAEAAQGRATYAQTWEDNRVAVGQMYVYTQLADLNDAVHAEFTELARQNAESVAQNEPFYDSSFE